MHKDSGLLSPCHGYWHLSWVTWRTSASEGESFPVPRDQLCYLIDVLNSLNRRVIVTVPFSLPFNCFLIILFSFPLLQRARAQSLVHSLSLIMVDASLGTIQCLEEIVSTYLAWVWSVFVILDVLY